MNKLNIRLKVILGYAVILLLMVAVSTIAYKNIKSLIDTSSLVVHTTEVISIANKINANIVDMETGKRGYLITGVESYLEPYHDGVEKFDKNFIKGINLTQDNQEQNIRWKTIKTLKEKWIIESALPEIKLRKEVNKGQNAITNFKAILKKSQGKELFDDIRVKLKNLTFKSNHNYTIQSLLTSITLSLVNMETGQRGYLLTGQKEYLEPYLAGEKGLLINLDTLGYSLSKTSEMTRDIMLIKVAVALWKSEVAEVEIEARKQMSKYKYSIDDITKKLGNGKGKFYMDKIRIQIIDIINTEERLSATRLKGQEKSAKFALDFTLAGTSFALLFGLIVAIIISRNIYKTVLDNQKKDKLFLKQSKLAAMGEMVGAIAHQWRQPLNTLALQTQFIEDDFEDGLVDEKYLNNYAKESMKMINFMSKTIDDFRNFFTIDKIKKEFSVREKISQTSNMLISQLKSHEIELDSCENDFTILGYESEFQQVILNLINNAKDALVENEVNSPKITIDVKTNKDEGIITIKDNAGGIPSEVIDRIFEPYFTTKEQGKGTGLGLYMSKMIIEDNMGAEISVKNEKEGAVFTINFKLRKED